jgi:hypothetical protein
MMAAPESRRAIQRIVRSGGFRSTGRSARKAGLEAGDLGTEAGRPERHHEFGDRGGRQHRPEARQHSRAAGPADGTFVVTCAGGILLYPHPVAMGQPPLTVRCVKQRMDRQEEELQGKQEPGEAPGREAHGITRP